MVKIGIIPLINGILPIFLNMMEYIYILMEKKENFIKKRR